MATKVQTHPLISIRSNAKVQEAAQLMADRSIGALGVLGTDRQFIGIITERDLSWFVAQGRNAGETPIGQIANDFPVVVEGPIQEKMALVQMRRARVRHLIVREGDAYRIVSMRDFVLTPGKETVAGDIMTAPAVACRDEAFFEEVAELLADRDISGVPVVDATGAVVGVISERDLAHALGGPMVRLAVRRHSRAPSPPDIRLIPREARRAKEVMTTPPVTVTRDTRLDAIARLMRVNQINRVPVVENDQLIALEEHVRFEERTLFPLIERTLPEQTLGALTLQPRQAWASRNKGGG